MRQFVVIAHEAPADGNFTLNDLAGAGRIDLLCRCVNSALLLSHAVRENVRLHIVVDDTVAIEIDGSTVRHLHPDERSIAARLQNALQAAEEAIGYQPVESAPGIKTYRLGVAETLDRIEAGTIIQLHEDGTPIVEQEPPADPIFVLADHQSVTDTEQTLLDTHCDQRITLGPQAIHADQAITVANNYLDTEGFTQY